MEGFDAAPLVPIALACSLINGTTFLSASSKLIINTQCSSLSTFKPSKTMDRRSEIKRSYRALPNLSTPVFGANSADDISDELPLPQQQRSHFLDSCYLCKKGIGGGRDVFMYRGDVAFCSDECREEQIEIDEAKEKLKSWKKQLQMQGQHNSSGAQAAPLSQESHVSRVRGAVVAG